MIIQCPACRALVDVREALLDDEGRRAGLACPECAEVAWLRGEAAEGGAGVSEARSEAEAQTEANAKPAEAEPGEAGERLEAEAPPADEALVEALSALEVAEAGEAVRDDLVQLLARWEDAQAHKAVLQKAVVADQLAVLGQGYRAVLEHRPDDKMATEGREGVLAAAMSQLQALPPDNDLARGKRVVTVIGVVISMIFVLLAAALIFRFMAEG